MTLGTKLYNLRKEKKISLEELAFELDISKTAIGKWEADKTKPSIDNIMKICDYYETDIYKLLEDVHNINFNKVNSSNIKTKENSFSNFNTSPECINSIVTNQKKIISMIQIQAELIIKLLKVK